ncbi:uncharacterized protein LOC144927407 [Branchiostoma floridae x Branchiostoma belcheri]
MSNGQAKSQEFAATKTRTAKHSSFSRGTASSLQKSGTRSQEEQLWDAICNDDLKKVHTVLCTAQNLNLNKPYTVITIDKNQGRDTCSTTYLLQACKVCRSAEIACGLIRAGANVNTSAKVLKKVPYGSTWLADAAVGNVTPLILAVVTKNEELVRCLIQLGADVNSTNEAGESPLHFVFTGATPNPSHATRKTPIAAKDRNATDTVFAALVENGADLNVSDRQGFTPLHVAAERGCLEEVQALVKAGADINVQTPVTGLTPLSLAKHANNAAVVNYLVQHAEGKAKSDETKRQYNATPLIFAVIQRQEELVKKLLYRCGADVNATNDKGLTPLHFSVISSFYAESSDREEQILQQIAITRLLLTAGAAVDLANKQGKTPLYFAAEERDVTTARLLIQHRARADIPDDKGLTPLHVSAKNRDTEMCELLLSGDDSSTIVNLAANDGTTPLHALIKPSYWGEIENDDTTLLKLFIEKGAVLTAQKYGLTPLHQAAHDGLINTVQTLVEAGADIHAETPNTGLTPLDMAEHRNRQDVIDYLTARQESETCEREKNKREEPSVEKEEEEEEEEEDETENLEEGAVGGKFEDLVIKEEYLRTLDVTWMNAKFKCPAVQQIKKEEAAKTAKKVKVTQMLSATIQCRKLDNKFTEDSTMLHLCSLLFIIQRNVELVEKLIHRCGADVNARNIEGFAPLHFSVQVPSNVYIPLNGLRSKYKKISPSRTESTEEQDLEQITRLLLTAGAAVDLADKQGKTPLYFAAVERDVITAQLLLQHRARADIPDIEGLTPLHISAQNRDTEMCELLLSGDDSSTIVNLAANDGTTPLHALIKPSYWGEIENDDTTLLKLFIEKGAVLTAQKYGLTPLHQAAYDGLINTVQTLVEAGADIHAETPNTGLTPLDMAEHRNRKDVIDYLTARQESETCERGTNKREEPSVEKEEEEEEDETENLEEGAVGGKFEELVIKEECFEMATVSLREQLGDAISENDLQQVQKLLFSGANIDLNEPYEVNVYKEEYYHGANTYTPLTETGKTTYLLQACLVSSPVLVSALVKAGANVNDHGNVMSRHSIHPNTRQQIYCRQYNATPLILAVIQRNVELVKKLLHRCGADVNASNIEGLAALHLSVHHISFILRNYSKIKTSTESRTESTEEGDVGQIASLLLMAGAAVDVTDKNGCTPLYYAARANEVATARLLLQHQARADIPDIDGLTPLHISAQNRDTEMCELLLSGDDSSTIVNLAANDGTTPLHALIQPSYWGEPDDTTILKLFIEKGAVLTAQKYGLTPLHQAAYDGLINTVQALVEAGADIHAETPNTGLTPLDMAEHQNNQEVIEYLTARQESETCEREKNKREEPSVEKEEEEEEEDEKDNLEEGAVGGKFEELVIKEE